VTANHFLRHNEQNHLTHPQMELNNLQKNSTSMMKIKDMKGRHLITYFKPSLYNFFSLLLRNYLHNPLKVDRYAKMEILLEY
jgi:hypothetical protein